MTSRFVRAAVVIVGLAAASGTTQAQEFVLDASIPAASKPVTLQVPSAGGTVSLAFVNLGATAASGASIRVAVTPFLSDTGHRLLPLLENDREPAKTASDLTLAAAAEGVVRCSLVVPSPSAAGPFTGSIIARIGDRPPVRYAVTLTTVGPPRPASLHLAPETDARTVTIANPFRGYSPPSILNRQMAPTFELRLTDAGGRWPLGELAIGPVAIVKAPHGSPPPQLAFYRGDTRVGMPLADLSRDEALTLQVGDLTAGEYTLTVPFYAGNGSLEARRLTISLSVRHQVMYAVLCLSMSLLLSFAASKLLDIRAARTRLVERIQTLPPRWLSAEEETVAVVWVQSIVAQAAQLARARLLPSLETIHQRLDTVQSLLTMIDALRRARLRLAEANLPRLALARARAIADRIADRLDPDMDSSDIDEETQQIAELKRWAHPNEICSRYAEHLQQSIDGLVADVDVTEVPAAGHTEIASLMGRLRQPPPATLPELEERERIYAALKILWERRTAPEFDDLLHLQSTGASLEQLFEAADNAAWARLRRTTAARIVLASHPQGHSPRALEPMTFAFTSGDRDLDVTYLVQRGMVYQWRFEMSTRNGAHRVTLQPETVVPRVPQYAPFAGVLVPVVTLRFGAHEPLRVMSEPVSVFRSRTFAAVNGFSTGEILRFLLAFAVAVITGLQTFYYKSGGFGSLADYLSLFAWGATVDQLKNFLQRLPAAAPAQMGSVSSALPPAPTTPTALNVRGI